MLRREFIAGLGAVAALPVAVQAQQTAVPIVGYVGNFPTSQTRVAVVSGLADTGFVEGRNVAIEYRWVEGRDEKLPAILHDLIERRVAVLATVSGTAAALAAKAATQTIPIVFRVGGDPVAIGLVPNLNKPGGNVTGATTLGIGLGPKRLQILRELMPTGARVALFSDPRNPNAAAEVREIVSAAEGLGVRLLVLNASSPSELDVAFEMIVQQDVGGLLNAADPFIFSQQDRIIALAARRKIPGVYSAPVFVQAGGLMSYGTDGIEDFRMVGTYIGRVLKGEKPSDLPVQQSTKIKLAINLKTAKALGLTIPETLLATADEVIQ
jgi:putative ABC transport system substrate-binding protein